MAFTVGAFCKITDDIQRDRLLRSAREDHEYVRAQAVRALGRIAPSQPEVVAALKAATEDSDPEVRRQAELAITGKSQSQGDAP